MQSTIMHRILALVAASAVLASTLGGGVAHAIGKDPEIPADPDLALAIGKDPEIPSDPDVVGGFALTRKVNEYEGQH